MKKMYSDNVAENRGKYFVLARGKLMPEGNFEYRGFHVVERATDQTIKVFDDISDARAYAKSLEGGRAFDGWTPTFILQSSAKIN
jgi:hypothetical protein